MKNTAINQPSPSRPHPFLLSCRAADPGEDDALREALLGDVEAQGAGASTHWTLAAKDRKHSWVALLAIAAKYMWPEDTWLQASMRGGGVVLMWVGGWVQGGKGGTADGRAQTQ